MKFNQLVAVILIFLFVGVTACSNPSTSETPSDAPDSGRVPAGESLDIPDDLIDIELMLEDFESEIILFTDAAGREVELPESIERVIPASPLAQVVLYTLCPDKIAGWTVELTNAQIECFGDNYASLPVFGDSHSDVFDLKSVMEADAQVIIDVGELTDTTKEDMEDIQEKTGVPTIFIQMDLSSMAEAYTLLGEITEETEQSKVIADYIRETMAYAKSKSAAIPQNERVKIYSGGAKEFAEKNADLISLAGAVGVPDSNKSAGGDLSAVSAEQLMLWQPTAPYNWMGDPQSVNRIIGIKWLGNLVYPDVFDCDMIKETQIFYEIFYHYDISEDSIRELLAPSIKK